MTRAAIAALVFLLAGAPTPGAAQEADLASFLARLDDAGRVEISGGLAVSLYDYEFEGGKMEAILVCPGGEAARPGILLVPGYSRGARDYLSFAVRLARSGFACLAVTQPGFGASSGPSDFAGPRTVRALSAGLDRFRRESCVDSTRLGVFGFSRGAMAASLLAVQRGDLGAAVLGAGIYDLARAWKEIEDPGIRDHIEREAGVSGESFRDRSCVWRAAGFAGPVLILHGKQDRNAPVSQAHLLAERLTALDKRHELVIFDGEGHDLPAPEVVARAQEFFTRVFAAGEPAEAAPPPPPATPERKSAGRLPENPEGRWRGESLEGPWDLRLSRDGTGAWNDAPIRWRYLAGTLVLSTGDDIEHTFQTELTGVSLTLSSILLEEPVILEKVDPKASPGRP